MTDRINGFTVVLSKDIREDDFEAIKNAVLMIKGVLSIEPNIVTSDDFMAKVQSKAEFRNKLYDFIDKELK